MKVTNLLLIGLLFSLVSIGCGQAGGGEDAGTNAVSEAGDDVKSAIEERLGGYLDATNNKEWDKSFDFLSPIIFDIAPREQMVAAFERMDSSGLTITVNDYELQEFEELVSWEGTQYTKFTYDCDMNIEMGGEQFSDPIMMEMMTQQMVSQYGEENVQFDSTANVYSIDAERKVWALTGPEGEWYFVEENPQLDMVLDQIVPDTVQTMMGL